MANATQTDITVMVPAKATGIVLTLTMEEATFLRDVLNLIGGCPKQSRRFYADQIDGALLNADVGRGDREFCGGLLVDVDRSSRIMFNRIERDLA